ncbi:hypothetical protein HWD35_20655 [Tsukamurella tyrosinosolvens]|uniref:hypothetical protein n=1 Tax=Tsukamurella tyrosinosolvens TaxID=57704 RepID=UPI001CE128B1|nr:hypothetical protein [Tsukamurella tyrosinosolvens]MCA4997136.1 hypothetical protein [Tsukamurella tyrosinosolvens]
MITRVAAVTFTAAVVVACGTSSDGDPSGDATTSAMPAGEKAALEALDGACSEGTSKVYLEARNTLVILERNGVQDETVTSVLQHLRDSIPAGTTVPCDSQLATYVQLRAPGAK